MLFRVTGTDVHYHQPREYFVEAADAGAAAAWMGARGLELPRAEACEAAPAGALVYRARPPAEPSEPASGGARGVKSLAVGFGLALVLVLMAWFVLRAKEHLTRTDLRPRLPAGAAPVSPVPGR